MRNIHQFGLPHIYGVVNEGNYSYSMPTEGHEGQVNHLIDVASMNA
jgi:hypothetical protein